MLKAEAAHGENIGKTLVAIDLRLSFARVPPRARVADLHSTPFSLFSSCILPREVNVLQTLLQRVTRMACYGVYRPIYTGDVTRIIE